MQEVIRIAKFVKMASVDSRQRSTLNGDHHDPEYNETLSQIYDTVLASLDNRTIKHQRKTPLLFRRNELDESTFDVGEPKSDNLSTSTAESDGTSGHQYESFETMKTQDAEPPTSFLGGTVKGSTANLKKGIAVRLQKSWRALRGYKPGEIFLCEARYPSEAREPC